MKRIQFSALALSAIVALPFVACNKSEEDIVANVDLVPVQVSKEKWSFVDPEGKILFEDEFKNSPTVVYNGYFSVREKENFAFYKVTGDKYDVVGDLDGLKSVGYMSEGMVVATLPHQRINVFDSNGKKKFELSPVGGKEVVSSDQAFSDGLLAFCTEESKVGYYDKSGKVAIKPSYDIASSFSEGLAVVGKRSDDDKVAYSVINSKGETVFKIKDGQTPKGLYNYSDGFSDGYLIVRDDDRDILYNTKGETTKFSTKVNSIDATNGKFVLFQNEDHESGVVDMEGNVVVRPKYSNVYFNGSEGFIGVKDDECVFLDKEGKEVSKLDYKNALPYGKFGYFVYDGNRYALVDKEGKEKGKEDYYDVNPFRISGSYSIYTDYFDVNTVAKSVVDLISANGVGTLKFGSTPGNVIKDKEPKDFSYGNNTTDLESLNQEGFRYKITAQGYFTASIMDYDYNFDSYNYEWRYNYYWNPNAKLGAVGFEIDTETDWGKDGYDAIIKELKAKGFKVNKEGYQDRENYAALLSKGTIYVYVTAKPKHEDGAMMVLDSRIENCKELVDHLSNQITKSDGSAIGGSSDTSADTVVAVEEVAAPAN